jgi:hypothetical protein
MKFGVREICDVVLKAKANQKVGNKIFYKHEPVIYFDTLKTSSMEGAATTVYAQGGRGNSRLMAWEGERTVTFTMEDALISPAGFMILSGAGLIEGGSGKDSIKLHTTEQTDDVEPVYTGEGESRKLTGVNIYLKQKPYGIASGTDYAYVMLLNDGEVVTEPYIPQVAEAVPVKKDDNDLWIPLTPEEMKNEEEHAQAYQISLRPSDEISKFEKKDGEDVVVLVDYYVEKGKGTFQIDITPDKFGGNYYLEASTLFRNTDGVDMPAEFIIPNCKIQSNFSFTMASSGDPSTFTFTIDAFPDYTRFDKTKKVLAAIQVVESTTSEDDSIKRESTKSNHRVDKNGMIVR